MCVLFNTLIHWGVVLGLSAYQCASALTGRLSTYAAKLSAFQAAKFAGNDILAAEVKEKVLVVAFEEGAATFEQAKALEEFLRLAKSTWPDIKVVFSVCVHGSEADGLDQQERAAKRSLSAGSQERICIRGGVEMVEAGEWHADEVPNSGIHRVSKA